MSLELNELPSVDDLARHPRFRSWDEYFSHSVRVQVVRSVLEQARSRLKKGEAVALSGIEKDLEDRYVALAHRGLRKAINATGVVLHTNLGRAPLGREPLEEMARELSGYCLLEWDEERGERGARGAGAGKWLALLTGAPASCLVNNNAAALYLILHALVPGKAVLLSRGEMVQIGGGFRVPEILEAAGARLWEVGTTNMTSLQDYARAWDSDRSSEIACLLKILPSNFVIEGHTESAGIRELLKLASAKKVPLVVDLGSGLLEGEGEEAAHSVRGALRAGADLICFSGDKLLGGPQAGIVLGKPDLVDKLRHSPLYRALRLGKTELFLLERALAAWAAGTPPLVSRLLGASSDSLRRRAESLRASLGEAWGKTPELVPGQGPVGGGSLPGRLLDTWLIEIPTRNNPERIARELARGEPSVLVRRENGRLFVDLRSVPEEDERFLVDALTRIGVD